MTGPTCFVCKILAVIAILGLLNLGAEGVTQVNYLARFLGEASTILRVLYVVMGVAGLALVAKCFGMNCPGCCKK